MQFSFAKCFPRFVAGINYAVGINQQYIFGLQSYRAGFELKVRIQSDCRADYNRRFMAAVDVGEDFFVWIEDSIAN